MAEIVDKNNKYNETVEELLNLLHPNKLTSWDDATKVDRDRKCLRGSLIEVLELSQKKQIEAIKNNSNISDILILRESVNEIITKGLIDEIFSNRISSETQRYDEIFNHISHNLDELDELKDKIMSGIELESDYKAIISNSGRDNYLANVQKVALDISLKQHGLNGFIGTNLDIRNVSNENTGLSENVDIDLEKKEFLKKYAILKNSKIILTHDGEMVSENSVEELIQVKEILKDDKFFEYGLKHLPPEQISKWINHADKNVFKNNEVVKLVALKTSPWLGTVPKEIRNNPELMSEIASMPGVNYEHVIDYVPSSLIDGFTEIWEKANDTKISAERLEEIKQYTKQNEERDYAKEKYTVLSNAKLILTIDDGLTSENSKEELLQVKEILKDDKFFEYGLKHLPQHTVSNWVSFADKNVFNNKEIVKLLALKDPVELNNVPKEIRNNPELMREIASMPGVNYESVIDYVPIDLMDGFTKIWEKANDTKISDERLEEIKYYARQNESNRKLNDNGNGNPGVNPNEDINRTYISEYEYVENGVHYHLPNWNTEPHVQLKTNESSSKIYENQNETEPHVRLK